MSVARAGSVPPPVPLSSDGVWRGVAYDGSSVPRTTSVNVDEVLDERPDQMDSTRREIRLLRLRRVAAAALVVALSAGACSPGTDVVPEPTTAPSTTVASAEPDATAATAEAPSPDGTATTAVTADTAPRRGGTLKVLLPADPTPISGWTPWDHVCAWSCRNVADHVLETLTVILPDGSIAPWLAESVTPDASLQRWTVKLRPNIVFSDGEPLEALTIKTGIDDYIRSGRASGGHLRDARIASVVVEDESTLVFEVSEPNAGLPAALAGPVGRVFSVTAAEADPELFARAPVGTGPFVFRRWSAGEPAVLEANENYWRLASDGQALPLVDEIQFIEVTQEQERLGTLLAGRGDILMSRSAELATAVTAAEDASGRPLHVVRRFDDNAGAVLFNVLRSPLDDVRVRRALVLAADQQRLLRSLGPDVDWLAATQWWAPGSIWHSARVAEAWPSHDAVRAAELLAEYIEDPERSDDGDSGAAIRIRALCTDDLALAQMTAELKRQWEATGLVNVEIETVARTGLISRVMGSVADSPSFKGDFAATCWRVGGESDPSVLLSAAVGPVRTTPLNVSNLAGEHLSALVSLSKATAGDDERRQAVSQLMLELTNELPHLYLGYSVSVLAANSQVSGLGRRTLPDGRTVEGQRLGVGRYDEVWLTRE